MIPQDSLSDLSSDRSRKTLLNDDSVTLFDTSRTILGAVIVVGLFAAMHFWL